MTTPRVFAIGLFLLGSCGQEYSPPAVANSHLLTFEDGRGASASRDETGRITARYYESDGTILSTLSFLPSEPSTSVDVQLPPLGCSYQELLEGSLDNPGPLPEYPGSEGDLVEGSAFAVAVASTMGANAELLADGGTWKANGCNKPCNNKWKACCDVHDECYCKNGGANGTPAARKACDDAFHMCLRKAGANSATAWLYWIGVRIGGGKYFRRAPGSSDGGVSSRDAGTP